MGVHCLLYFQSIAHTHMFAAPAGGRSSESTTVGSNQLLDPNQSDVPSTLPHAHDQAKGGHGEAESMWYFCPALDAFQVELGADIRDAFLSPSKQTVPLQSDVALPLLHAYDLPLSPLHSPTPSSASIAHSPTHDHPERRASASSSDDSGLGDDIDNDDDNGLDETLSGEPPTTGRWTKKEHELFLEGLRRYGKSWKSISNLVVSRTLVQIRTHAQKYLQKQSRSSKTGAAYQYLAGNQPPSRHHTFHHQQAQSTLPHHLAMSSFFMPHQQQQLRWPVPPAFQNDAIYRQLILANQQHLSTTSNNVIDELLDRSDDDNENADDGNQPNNHDEWDDDDDNELQHMMMGCETSGDKRRSSAPAMSSSLKPLAPSVGFKRRRLDETGTAYLDPAVSYVATTNPSTHFLFPSHTSPQQLGGSYGHVLRSPQLI
ncbi:hypothetical protein DYB25_002029 [Aphanomyces astaci]|uniref:Uncharacterized protein n=1 Tax=Aphanomyces astaci TaxID=112090 RepID=A0A397ACY8_APHAT|nr:hypothetical protein DYB25_002029 [Aphanomyces astaci]RHY88465.1 hypothetical protein DYB26_000698 [Aphanomyces astaci]